MSTNNNKKAQIKVHSTVFGVQRIDRNEFTRSKKAMDTIRKFMERDHKFQKRAHGK